MHVTRVTLMLTRTLQPRREIANVSAASRVSNVARASDVFARQHVPRISRGNASEVSDSCIRNDREVMFPQVFSLFCTNATMDTRADGYSRK